MEPYPLLFTPVYKDYLWGGTKIASHFKRDVKGRVAESWEISERPEGMSVVNHGTHEGSTLAELAEQYPLELIGQKMAFPLLFKILDANDHLSMQVHPHDDNAHLTGGDPKSEMWIVMDADPDAVVYVGWNKPMDKERVLSSLGDHTIMNQVCKVPVKAMDTIYIPGGTIHAVGKGCLIYEVQQTSNTTYRFYDWDRVDAEGNQRDLHIKEGLQVLNYSPKESPLEVPNLLVNNGAVTILEKVVSPYFWVRHCTCREPIALEVASFMVIFSIGSLVRITSGGSSVVLNQGSSTLIPACAKEVHIEPIEGEASLILTTLP